MTQKSSGLRFEVNRQIGLLPNSVLLVLANPEWNDVEQGKDWLGNLINIVSPKHGGIALCSRFENRRLSSFATNSLVVTEIRARQNNLAGNL